MSKFNTPKTIKVKNFSGNNAYKMNDKDKLITATLTSFFGEPKYYNGNSDIEEIAISLCKTEPEFVAKLACYTRNIGNMRSVSHVLCGIIAHEAPAYTRRVVRNIINRPDDILEILSYYESRYGKPFPNALKREIGDVIQKFNEFQIAKYNGGNKNFKFRDVLRITHPSPKTDETNELFKKILNDTLETPYTWEVELSTRGNNKEVWDELISSGKVGYMALLRNLRNIVKSGADLTPVLEKISDPNEVRKSKQLPFRFFSAYKTLLEGNLLTPEIHKALESAIRVSVDNMEKIEGRTLIAIDVSGSMQQKLSRKSDVKCCDVGALLGAMAAYICEDATVCCFDCSNGINRDGYVIKRMGKYDSILGTAVSEVYSGYGTDLSIPMKFALNEDKSRDLKAFDRIIYFSDNETNQNLKTTVQSYVNKYRREYNNNFWVHGVDLAGYGTQQFCGRKFNLITGWSENVIPFINLAEKGIGSLTEQIEMYDLENNCLTEFENEYNEISL